MPARYPRGRRQRGNIFIAPSEREVGGSKTDGGGRAEREKSVARSVRREVELRVIEKPVVHPDRRFISLVHARRCTGASLLLSRPSTHSLPSSPVVSPLALSPSARRNKKDEKEATGQMPAVVSRDERGDGRGTEGGEGEKKRKKIVRNNARGGAFSRDY